MLNKFSEEREMLHRMMRKLSGSMIRPLTKKIDVEENIPHQLFYKIAKVGLLGTAFSEK